MLRVEARDSPDIEGSVCVSVAQLAPSDTARMRAERAFASAGAADFRTGDAKGAFEEYLEAARNFDSIDRKRAAQARHAMSELAYGKISREDDAYWLSRVALADLGPTSRRLARRDPSRRGERACTRFRHARCWSPSASIPTSVAPACSCLLGQGAARLRRTDPFGARELPRLDILRGFMEYRVRRLAEANSYFTQAASEVRAAAVTGSATPAHSRTAPPLPKKRATGLWR